MRFLLFCLLVGLVWSQQVELRVPAPSRSRTLFAKEDELYELFDRGDEEVRIVFAIDCSASMREVWERVVKSALLALSELPENVFFGMVVFSSACEGGAVLWRRTLVRATTRNRAIAMRWLTIWRPAGCSTLIEAIENAFSLGDGISLFLAADDIPNVGKVKEPDVVIEKAARMVAFNRGRINTIFIGEDGKAASFFADLAYHCNGSFAVFCFTR